MRGRIKRYFPDKGYGFIVSEKNEDYFFHISKIKSMEQPYEGASVNFLSKQGNNGLVAEDIHIEKNRNEQKADVVKLGNVRIRLNSIKNYGVSSTEYYYLKVYKRKVEQRSIILDLLLPPSYIYITYDDKKVEITKSEADKLLNGSKIPKRVLIKKGESYRIKRVPGTEITDDVFVNKDTIIESLDSFSYPSDLIREKERYLYVTTYQNDNYTFYESQMDIDSKINELDQHFNKD